MAGFLGGLDALVAGHKPTRIGDLSVERAIQILGIELIVRLVEGLGDAGSAVRHRLNERLRQPALRETAAEQHAGYCRMRNSGLILGDHVQPQQRGGSVVVADLAPKPIHQARVEVIDGCVCNHLGSEVAHA